MQWAHPHFLKGNLEGPLIKRLDEFDFKDFMNLNSDSKMGSSALKML